jgi:hypothetical protein
MTAKTAPLNVPPDGQRRRDNPTSAGPATRGLTCPQASPYAGEVGLPAPSVWWRMRSAREEPPGSPRCPARRA